MLSDSRKDRVCGSAYRSFGEAWETGTTQAGTSGEAQIVVARMDVPVLEPLAVFEALTQRDRFFWSQPARGRWMVAEGEVASVKTDGAGRIREAEARWAREMARVHCANPETREALRWLGGFSFDGSHRAREDWARFPAGHLTLPHLLFVGEPEGGHAIWAHRIEPGASDESAELVWQAAVATVKNLVSAAQDRVPEPVGSSWIAHDSNERPVEYSVAADRAHSVYRSQVAKAVEAIADGKLEKVVLARSLEVRHRGRYAVPNFLERLCAQYPACTVLGVVRGGHALVSASPEFLISLDGDTLHTQAVAGSAPRGSSPEQDVAFARALRESKKDQAEHAAVVRAVRSALQPLCGELHGPEAPVVLPLEGIQHLSTPLSGELRESSDVTSVLELLDLLHPTPAVCGVPRETARAWIESEEDLDRGWYAGPVGWVSADGAGEFWLALRSGLILQPDDGSAGEPSRAKLYAGAGIVEASEPELELVETRLKLRALLAPLTEI